MNKKLSTIVDELGVLKAALSELKSQESDLKEILKNAGRGVIEGNLFRCSIHTQPRPSINWKGIALKYDIPQRVIDRFTTRGICTTVRISAKVAS